MKPIKCMCVIGTRPEAIKMAPVISALQGTDWARCRVVLTGQHRDLCRPVLDLFSLAADADLDVMVDDQALSVLTARLHEGLGGEIRETRPDIVIAQGDTASAYVAALEAYYHGIPFCHVEAGLRTGRLQEPFPEEYYRMAIAPLAWLNFAPTEHARDNLRRENISEETIVVTGNTAIDALHAVSGMRPPMPLELDPAKRYLLVTTHRRENFGVGVDGIIQGVSGLLARFDNVGVIWLAHPNPAVKPIVETAFAGHDRVHVLDAVAYDTMVSILGACDIVLTDSGGLQEEAPALGRPVFVTRNATERQETVDAGTSVTLGTNPDRIVDAVSAVLESPEAYARMARTWSPYGDGKASQRIVHAIRDRLEHVSRLRDGDG
ncbi:MAG: UDP-N-acetylglucosamine 2-epimerase (non-hydrolyzing) [Rhodospirillales bacterium]